MKTFAKPIQILLVVITVLITELGLLAVFLDSRMGQRNQSIGSWALMLAFVFPAIIVPGVIRRTMKKVIASCFIVATLCTAYFLAIYRHLFLGQDMPLMLLCYIIVVIITAIMMRKDGLPA